MELFNNIVYHGFLFLVLCTCLFIFETSCICLVGNYNSEGGWIRKKKTVFCDRVGPKSVFRFVSIVKCYTNLLYSLVLCHAMLILFFLLVYCSYMETCNDMGNMYNYLVLVLIGLHLISYMMIKLTLSYILRIIGEYYTLICANTKLIKGRLKRLFFLLLYPILEKCNGFYLSLVLTPIYWRPIHLFLFPCLEKCNFILFNSCEHE